MSEIEAFEAEYSKCDFGIEGRNFKKNPDGSYESQQTYTAFHWFKKGSALASQAQQPEYTFDQLTKMMMRAATKEGHKVTMKIKWALPPAPEGGEK